MKINDNVGQQLMSAGAIVGAIAGIILSGFREEGGGVFLYNVLGCGFMGIVIVALIMVIAENITND